LWSKQGGCEAEVKGFFYIFICDNINFNLKPGFASSNPKNGIDGLNTPHLETLVIEF